MKRVCESMHFNEEVPSDVWSYIINIYHHLRFTEQWQKLKLACLSHNKYLLPVDNLEIPLYADTIGINTCSIYYRIRNICWGEDGHIIGALTDSFDFNPTTKLALRVDRPITVINGSYCPNIQSRPYYLQTATMVKEYENTRLSTTTTTLTIPLSAFPRHLFTSNYK